MYKPFLLPDLTPLADVKPHFDEVSQCLMDAAQIIRERGHTKGSALNERTGAVCTIGAIGRTDADFSLRLEVREIFKAHLGIVEIVSWNDAPERTAEEVIAALEGAAHARALSLREGEKG